MAQKVFTDSTTSFKLDEALRNYYRNKGQNIGDVFDLASEEANRAVNAVINTTQPRQQNLFTRLFRSKR